MGHRFAGRTSLTHIVNALYRAAGIDGGTSHSGRRSFITNLAERGVSVRVLMSLAGHQNLATTQRYMNPSHEQIGAQATQTKNTIETIIFVRRVPPSSQITL